MEWWEHWAIQTIITAGCLSGLVAVLLRPRFYLSLDGEECRQVVGSNTGLALFIRVKVERYGLKLINEDCRIWLETIWHNDKLIENESSPLQWTHEDTFDPLPVSGSGTWANLCGVYESNPSNFVIVSAKGLKGFPSQRPPGRYRFDIVAGGRFSSQGKMSIIVNYNPTHFCNLGVESCRTRRKVMRMFRKQLIPDIPES